MIKTRALNKNGLALFEDWLTNGAGQTPPAELLTSDQYSEPFGDWEIDPDKVFSSRFEFGRALNSWLTGADFSKLMAADSDGFWAWAAFVYFAQLTAKGIRRSEHYIVMRKGAAGSLAYRHAVRTPYELVHIHGDSAEICLISPMHTFGDMTEQLASRQVIAHNRGFFRTAYEMYVADGRLKPGAASKPKKPKERKPGERTGFGSVRRLAVALQRLDLTYDTDEMSAGTMKAVLPAEFRKYANA